MFHVEHSTRAVFLTLLFGGCSGDGSPGDSGVLEPPMELHPLWDASTAESELDAMLADGLPHGLAVRDAYLELIVSGGDDACPGEGLGMTTSANEACTSDAGFVFFGSAELQEFESHSLPNFHLFTSASISGPKGEAFEGGGQVQQNAIREDESSIRVESEVNGSYRASIGPGWLQDGVSSVLQIVVDAQGPDVSVMVQGGFSRGIGSVVFHDLMIAPGHCGGEGLDGTMSIRDPSGLWFSWTPVGCTTCGPLHFGASELGQICMDGDRLIDTLVRELGLP